MKLKGRPARTDLPLVAETMVVHSLASLSVVAASIISVIVLERISRVIENLREIVVQLAE